MRPTSPRFLAILLGVAVVYFAAARLGLALAGPLQHVTLVWPPTGVAFAALLLLGRRAWPGVLAGAFAANAAQGEPLVTAAAIAVGNTACGVVGATLARRLADMRPALGRIRDVAALIGLGAAAAPLVSASVGVLSLCLTGLHPWERAPFLWFTWWLGDAMGVLLVAPVLLTWADAPRIRARGVLLAEGLTVLAGAALVSHGVFSGRLHSPVASAGLAYLVFPFLIWAALRFGQRGASLALLVTAIVAIADTVTGTAGPFRQATAHESLALLQLFMAAAAMSTLFLGAVTTARALAEMRLEIEHVTSRALAQGGSGDAARAVLRALSRTLHWDRGAVWVLTEDADALCCLERWQMGTANDRFDELTRTMTFARGVGLPGRVWQSGRAAWIPDVERDDNFPRAVAASEAGLHTALAVPIVLRGRVLGVLEFFSREISPPNAPLLETLTVVGTQIGQSLERRTSEDRLRATEALKGAMLESSLDAVIGMSHDGRITEFNPAAERTFGWTREEVMGRALADVIVPPDLRAAHQRGLRRYLETGRGDVLGRRIEMRALRRDGAQFPVEVAIVRIGTQDPPRFSGYLRDITDRKQAESAILQANTELKRSNAELESFAYVASHDLQEPLRTVLAYAQLLGARFGDRLDDETREILDFIVGGARRMSALVQDLLSFSRIGHARTPVPVPAGHALQGALANLERTIGETGARITVSDLPVVRADPRELLQLFQNLVGNAIKFSGGRVPEVSVTAEVKDGEAEFAVADNGIGIPREYLEKVFVLFQRLNPRDYAGTGLGLAICKKIVEGHGGRIWVDSEPGKGSAFRFTMPAG